MKIFSAEFQSGQLYICYKNGVGYNLNFNENNTKVYCYGCDEENELVVGDTGLDIYGEALVG